MGESLSGNGWTPVALSTDLPNGGVMRAYVDTIDMALWRGHSGRVHAWNNRCPHRGMRLSFGFVRGDRLSCLYHGWQYGEDTACRHIPAHPDLEPPQSICATAYYCAEADGLIWVSTTSDDASAITPYGGSAIRSIAINAPADRIQSLLMIGGFPVSVPVSDAIASTPAHYQCLASEGRRLVVEGRAGGVKTTLVASLHELAPDRTMVHLQSLPEASPVRKTSLSRWAERMRWHAENLGAENLGNDPESRQPAIDTPATETLAAETLATETLATEANTALPFPEQTP